MASKTETARNNSLEKAIGLKLLALRNAQQVKLADLAKRTGLSVSMLSKVENGKISASLPTLLLVSNALSIPITVLFENHDAKKPVTLAKAGQSVGHRSSDLQLALQLTRLGRIKTRDTGVHVDPCIIELKDENDLYLAPPHNGMVTVFILQGAVEYVHADKVYSLEKGDTLFFRAYATHGPRSLSDAPAKFLSVTSLPSP